MLVELSIKQWNKDLRFFYPVKSIDHFHLMAHVIWKLSGDEQCIIKAKAQLDIDQTDYLLLNIKNWSFA